MYILYIYIIVIQAFTLDLHSLNEIKNIINKKNILENGGLFFLPLHLDLGVDPSLRSFLNFFLIYFLNVLLLIFFNNIILKIYNYKHCLYIYIYKYIFNIIKY